MSRITRLIAVCATAAGVVGLGSAAAATAGTHAARPTAAQARQAALTALHQVRVNPPPAFSRTGSSPSVAGLTKLGSINWAGYADDNTKGNAYSKVSSSWTQPAITCATKEEQLAAFWVGIDGFNSSTVEQDGTLAQCFEGSAFYYTWWEMYPSNAIQVVGTTVKPGDKIAASVVKSGTSYALKVTDSTTSGNNVSTTQTCAAATCKDASAEWIAEAPGGPRGEYPLPDFGSWTTSSASVTSGSKTSTISAFPDDEITMDQGNFTGAYALATPGALNSSGNSFKVTWDNSY